MVIKEKEIYLLKRDMYMLVKNMTSTMHEYVILEYILIIIFVL